MKKSLGNRWMISIKSKSLYEKIEPCILKKIKEEKEDGEQKQEENQQQQQQQKEKPEQEQPPRKKGRRMGTSLTHVKKPKVGIVIKEEESKTPPPPQPGIVRSDSNEVLFLPTFFKKNANQKNTNFLKYIQHHL